MTGRLYAEDLVEGSVFELGPHRVSAAEIIEFGRKWDPLPMHTDERAASTTPLGGLIASGIHTLAIYQRLQADALISRTAIVAGRGLTARLVRPVRAGSTLVGTTELVSVERKASGRAVVRTRGVLTVAGEPVLELDGDMLVNGRPS